MLTHMSAVGMQGDHHAQVVSEPSRVASLALMCCEVLTATARPRNVCQGLALAEVLSPVADLIKPQLMRVLIASLAQVVQKHAHAFCYLGEETIQDLLSSNLQVARHHSPCIGLLKVMAVQDACHDLATNFASMVLTTHRSSSMTRPMHMQQQQQQHAILCVCGLASYVAQSPM